MPQEPQISLSELRPVVEQMVMEVLSKMLGIGSGKASVSASVPIKAAVRSLGYKNARQIYADIEAGLLRVGHEVEDRRRPGKIQARYYVNIEAAKERLRADPARRRA